MLNREPHVVTAVGKLSAYTLAARGVTTEATTTVDTCRR